MKYFTCLSAVCCIITYCTSIETGNTSIMTTNLKNSTVSHSPANVDLSEHKNIVEISVNLINGLANGFRKTGSQKAIIKALDAVSETLRKMSATKNFDTQIVEDIELLMSLIKSGDTISDTFISQLQSLKMLFELNILVQDLDSYFAQHKNEINKYTKDMIEMSASIGAQIPIDETGKIVLYGDIEAKMQYGKQENGEFIESKQISLSNGIGANLFSMIKAKTSFKAKLQKGKKLAGIKSIASNNGISEKIKSKLSSTATEEYLTYKQKLLDVLKLTKQLPVALYKVNSLCKLFAINMPKNYRLSFAFKDGSLTTELMEAASVSASVSISSSALSELGLSVSTESRNIIYKLENDALTELKGINIRPADANFLSILGRIFNFSKEASYLISGNEKKYFFNIIKNSGISSLGKLLATTQTYLQALNKLASKDTTKQESKIFTKTKHEIEKSLGTTGRKQTIKTLGALLGYFSYKSDPNSASDTAYIQALEDVKQDIIKMSEYLQYSNSIRKSRKHLGSYKAVSKEQEVNISLFNNFIKFSCTFVTGNPNIYANGTDAKLTIDMTKLNTANNTISKILRILKIKEVDMPINELLAQILSGTLSILSKHKSKISSKNNARKAIEHLIEIINSINFKISDVDEQTTFKNRALNIIASLPLLSKKTVSLVITARAGGMEKDLTFLRIYMTQDRGISTTVSSKIDSVELSGKGEILLKATSGNIAENPNTLYNIAKEYIIYAGTHDADNKQEITQNDANAFVNQYDGINKLVKAFNNGSLNNSLKNYVQAIKLNSKNDLSAMLEISQISYDKSTNPTPDSVKKMIAKIIYLYYKYCAVPFKKKTYRKII